MTEGSLREKLAELAHNNGQAGWTTCFRKASSNDDSCGDR